MSKHIPVESEVALDWSAVAIKVDGYLPNDPKYRYEAPSYLKDKDGYPYSWKLQQKEDGKWYDMSYPEVLNSFQGPWKSVTQAMADIQTTDTLRRLETDYEECSTESGLSTD